MKRTEVTIWLLMIALGLGISILSLPQTSNAQTDKGKTEREKEDDDKDNDEKLSPEDKAKAKITMDEARAIALKRISGAVVEEELEKENGRLQYAFDIRDSGGKVWDVEIDAVTGEVLQAAEDDDGEDIGAKNFIVNAAVQVKRAVTSAVAKIF